MSDESMPGQFERRTSYALVYVGAFLEESGEVLGYI